MSIGGGLILQDVCENLQAAYDQENVPQAEA